MSARVSLFVMIETAEGLANVEEIAQVPGLGGVYVGPADLSIGLGLDPMRGFTTDQLAQPVERIRKACDASGIVLGMHQMNGASARRWIERGVRLATLGSAAGARESLDESRAIFEWLESRPWLEAAALVEQALSEHPAPTP